MKPGSVPKVPTTWQRPQGPHLELWRDPEPRRGDQRGTTPCDASEAPLEFCYEPVDDGWPGDEEPTYTLH